MNNILFFPILLPLLSGAIQLAFWRSIKWQRRLNLLAASVYLVFAAQLLRQVIAEDYLVLAVGSWAAPFGIALVSDMLSAIMILVTGIIGVASALYAMASVPVAHIKFGYFPLMQILLAGVGGAFVTGDLFNLFVWFEVMLLSSFGLLALGGEKAQMEGAIKYVTINLFSSALFLTAIGLLYATTGTLNFADLAQKLTTVESTGLLNAIAVMFMVSFAIKAGAFPLYFWLPASYHTPIVAVSAVFAGLLTKVGVYALFRLFSLVFNQDVAYTHTILLWVGVLTMLSGVLGAASQFEFRRILSFHIISQVGYMIVALAIFTPLAMIGGVFYIAHHIIVKANLFFISGITYRLQGTHQLKDMGGLYRRHPALAIGFMISAMSLAGIPPLSGFFAKLLVIQAGIESGAWIATAVALFVGLLTLYSMLKIWNQAFWKADPVSDRPAIKISRFSAAPVVLLASITVALGLGAEALWLLAQTASQQLLDPQGYIDAVLGG